MPYRGEGPTIIDMMAGQIGAMVNVVIENITSGLNFLR